nr:MAG TPA: hypothetical protein [Caudoviricetes sp.]
MRWRKRIVSACVRVLLLTYLRISPAVRRNDFLEPVFTADGDFSVFNVLVLMVCLLKRGDRRNAHRTRCTRGGAVEVVALYHARGGDAREGVEKV